MLRLRAFMLTVEKVLGHGALVLEAEVAACQIGHLMAAGKKKAGKFNRNSVAATI